MIRFWRALAVAAWRYVIKYVLSFGGDLKIDALSPGYLTLSDRAIRYLFTDGFESCILLF